MKKIKGKSKVPKTYILWVTTKKDEGYSSRWYGWTSDLYLTYGEALQERARVKEKFYAVAILKVR